MRGGFFFRSMTLMMSRRLAAALVGQSTAKSPLS
jgi:hypothetical protein